MASNKEINQILSERRQGIYRNGYLVCDTCHGTYELKAGEKPDDFSSECECGGHLTYTRNLPLNVDNSNDDDDDDNNMFDSPILNWLSRLKMYKKFRLS